MSSFEDKLESKAGSEVEHEEQQLNEKIGVGGQDDKGAQGGEPDQGQPEQGQPEQNQPEQGGQSGQSGQ